MDLKFPCRALDGSVYWAGMRAARKSYEAWIHTIIAGGQLPEIGVLYLEKNEKMPDTLKKISTTLNIKATIRFELSNESRWRWILGTTHAPIPTPSTYEVHLLIIKQAVETDSRGSLQECYDHIANLIELPIASKTVLFQNQTWVDMVIKAEDQGTGKKHLLSRSNYLWWIQRNATRGTGDVVLYIEFMNTA